MVCVCGLCNVYGLRVQAACAYCVLCMGCVMCMGCVYRLHVWAACVDCLLCMGCVLCTVYGLCNVCEGLCN